MKYRQGDLLVVHQVPLRRNDADTIFRAYVGENDGRNEWEQLWGKKIAPREVIVCCIPFFVYDLALGDEVEIDSEFALQRILRKSGQVTFRVWFCGRGVGRRNDILRDMNAMNVLMEWSSDNLLAVSVLDIEAQKLADYLQFHENEGELEYETGCT
ncbi:DUF4265 domain-containing protein [Dokdonella sp.]|uniref:DUF4265 domain-containing protein n=1 Tax=Dokdonella sp. TaxID=2291710 RepID=UPI0027BB188F|nr:DUF4265 domain-containing protein [Dokdonella sp.]